MEDEWGDGVWRFLSFFFLLEGFRLVLLLLGGYELVVELGF